MLIHITEQPQPATLKLIRDDRGVESSPTIPVTFGEIAQRAKSVAITLIKASAKVGGSNPSLTTGLFTMDERRRGAYTSCLSSTTHRIPSASKTTGPAKSVGLILKVFARLTNK